MSGAEGHPRRPELLHEGEQIPQVACHRGLADQQPHPGAQALASLLHGQRLVIRADTGGGVCVQRLAEDSRCVPVHVLGLRQRELRELGRVAGDDAREVHHLGQSEHALAAQQCREVALGERAPGRLEM